MSIRPVTQTSPAQPTMEGAGVKLHRAFGFQDPTMLDPFLLFDDFRNEHPQDYIRGFPWHPHRGIETITYVLSGTVDHGDSLGNEGTLGAGDVQWMTAGSGILHQEMPHGNAAGQMHGFQLWANLPGSLKMSTPRYQDVEGKDIPEIIDDDGTRVKIIVGEFWGKRGRGFAKCSRSTPIDAPLLTCLTARAISATPLRRVACSWKKKSWAKRSISATCQATARWSSLAQATR